MTGSLVFVDDAFVSHAIDHRDGSGISRFGRILVAAFDGGLYAFDICAHHGAKAGVMLAVFLRLFCALFGGLDIGHVGYLGKRLEGAISGAATMPIQGFNVNSPKTLRQGPVRFASIAGPHPDAQAYGGSHTPDIC